MNAPGDRKDDGFPGKSRSRKKRESTALQQRGAELAALSPSLLKTLPLSEELAESLRVWRGLKTYEAKRRHMQYIGRLMREQEDPDALLAALDVLRAESRQDVAREKRLEILRDALLDETATAREAAIARAMAECPQLSETHLRHLQEAALAERAKNRPPRHRRELFRYLRQGMG